MGAEDADMADMRVFHWYIQELQAENKDTFSSSKEPGTVYVYAVGTLYFKKQHCYVGDWAKTVDKAIDGDPRSAGEAFHWSAGFEECRGCLKCCQDRNSC